MEIQDAIRKWKKESEGDNYYFDQKLRSIGYTLARDPLGGGSGLQVMPLSEARRITLEFGEGGPMFG